MGHRPVARKGALAAEHIGVSVKMRLSARAGNGYLWLMQPHARPTFSSYGLLAALCAVGLAGGLGLAFWIEQGPEMFLSLVESGLAWCL